MSRGDRREDIFLDDVDRLLGEHGIGEDSAAGRAEFERRTEGRRTAEEEAEALAPIRRGWCLGSEAFRQAMLERMRSQLGEHHADDLRREQSEVRAERIVAEELGRLGWTEADWVSQPKRAVGKLALAARLRRAFAARKRLRPRRREATMPLK